jgi:hypothetical protein
MGQSLGYSFDKVMLKNEAYFPKGLADLLECEFRSKNGRFSGALFPPEKRDGFI